MIRRQSARELLPPSVPTELVAQLVLALKDAHATGQPFIFETDYGTGKFRILVIWDAWERYPLETRTQVIHEAYAQAEGVRGRERIGLASGLTIPEAVTAGMLPFALLAVRRSSDPVPAEEIERVLVEEGASTLAEWWPAQLRFSTQEEAEECRQRLTARLPGSEELWFITRDLGSTAAAFRSDEMG